VERAADDIEAWEAKTIALLLEGNAAEGMAVLEKTLALAPNREKLLVRAAQTAENLGRERAALDYWQRVIAINPGHWNDHYRIALLLEKAKEWAKALEACQEAIRLNPFTIEPRKVEVRCLLASGKKEQASAAFKVMLVLEPSRKEELDRWFTG